MMRNDQQPEGRQAERAARLRRPNRWFEVGNPLQVVADESLQRVLMLCELVANLARSGFASAVREQQMLNATLKKGVEAAEVVRLSCPLEQSLSGFWGIATARDELAEQGQVSLLRERPF